MLSTKGVNVASGVTNASLVMVGVSGKTIGPNWTGASVTNTADVGVEVGNRSPTTVGVGYCPHKEDEEVLPTQELANKEIATNKTGRRFTVDRCGNYTCIEDMDSSADLIRMILTHKLVQNHLS